MNATTTGSPLAAVPAIILAGGLGTRLRSVVADRPKVLAPVAGKPFLAYLLSQLDGFGISEATISTGYMAGKIEEEFGTEHRGIRLRYSQEFSALGTGGAIRLAAEGIGAEDILVLNGDSYCEADLFAFHEFHRDNAANFSILLTRVPDVARFGQVETDGAAIVRFAEKGASTGPGWINAGIYLVKNRILDEIPASVFVSLEQDVFPRLTGHGFLAFRGGSRFIDIGTPDSYSSAEEFFSGK